MASATLRMLSRVLALLLLTAATSSQSTSPQNDISSIDESDQFIMDTIISGMPVHPPLVPLTDQAGRTGSVDQRQKIQINGPLFLTTADTVDDLQAGSIAFASCEPGDYSGDLGSTGVLNRAVNEQAAAIVLYSTSAASCSFQPTNGFSYGPMYSMLAANLSEGIVRGLNNTDAKPRAGIHLGQNAGNSTNSGGSVLGKSPTTAVAMIILYSITGIITALFLIIIVVGAIRAHRHPERYGPRHVVGRPRQSRAKGIARAMLDTLPVVKFGDKENDKPAEANQDVEMAATTQAEHEDKRNTSERSRSETTRDASTADDPDAVRAEPAAGADQSEESKVPSGNPIDDGLACSVCTDDFVKGQDIRLLPCKHKFHPECIDPWLLNVSGTCPLCRIDLHPTNNEDEEQPSDHVPTLETRDADLGQEVGNGDQPSAETTRQNRRSRILSTLNIGRMRHATPQERLEALRSLRNERPADETARTRFSRRLSRALGSRPTSEIRSRPVSGVPPVASGALASTDETAFDQTAQSGTVDRRRMGSFAG